jgi:SH3 domain-containing YSC84-like protein 1
VFEGRKTAVAPPLADCYNPAPMNPSFCRASMIFVLLLFAAAPARAQYRETVIADDSREVLGEVMAMPATGIPASLLANAQGMVIIPDLVKGGFVVGVRHGRGVALVRDDRGAWRPPCFVTLTGGSVGWQIGLQVTDIVLVFKTRGGVRSLMNGKLTLGADAAAAAGPVGREAAAATDEQLQAQILTWSRSRGLFAGVSLDGSVVAIDRSGNAAFYGGADVTNPTQQIPVPAAGLNLMRLVSYYTGAPGESLTAVPGRVPTLTAGAIPVAAPGQAPGVADLKANRQQLAAASLRLHTILDANWRTYLDMPAEIYAGDRPVNIETMQKMLGRFDAVARDPQYATLARRAEFQGTHQWLARYVSAATSTARNVPTLAPPPK